MGHRPKMTRVSGRAGSRPRGLGPGRADPDPLRVIFCTSAPFPRSSLDPGDGGSRQHRQRQGHESGAHYWCKIMRGICGCEGLTRSGCEGRPPVRVPLRSTCPNCLGGKEGTAENCGDGWDNGSGWRSLGECGDCLMQIRRVGFSVLLFLPLIQQQVRTILAKSWRTRSLG